MAVGAWSEKPILTAAEVHRAEIMAMLKIDRAWHDECEGRADFVEGATRGLADEAAPQRAEFAPKRRKKRRTRPQSRA